MECVWGSGACCTVSVGSGSLLARRYGGGGRAAGGCYRRRRCCSYFGTKYSRRSRSWAASSRPSNLSTGCPPLKRMSVGSACTL